MVPSLHLIAPGEALRRTLDYVYDRPEGRLVIDVDWTRGATDRGRPGFRSEVVLGGSGSEIAFRVESVKFLDVGESPLNRLLESYDATAGTFRVTSRGGVEGFSLDPSCPVADFRFLTGLQIALLWVFPPLPADPVGPGSRWALEYEAGHGAVRYVHAVEYRLERLEGSRVDLAVRVEGRDLMPAAATPFEVGGSGTLRLDLARLVPAAEIETRVRLPDFDEEFRARVGPK